MLVIDLAEVLGVIQ